MKNEGLQYTYRSAMNILPLVIAIIFSVVALWATAELKDVRIGAVTIVVFLCTICLGLRIVNERVVLTQDKIMLIRKDIKNYDDFLKIICNRLNIKGYTRGGLSEFNMK